MNAFFEALKTLLQNIQINRKVSPSPQSVVIPPPVPKPVPIPSPVVTPQPTPPASTGFLICPVKLKDSNGNQVTSRTAPICSVIDHSGTDIELGSGKWWGLAAKDQKVKAFNGEMGDGVPSAGKPYGYTKKMPSSFFTAKEINYVGSAGAGDQYGPTFYLNYDGHAGYDFRCAEGTSLIAPAGGELYKAQEDPVGGTNKTWSLNNLGKSNPTAWDGWHTFFIKHPNGYSTYFLHCTKLADAIEAQLTDYQKHVSVKQGDTIAFSGRYGGVAPHLHFEVRNSEGKIVDPYKDNLWSD